MAKNTCIICGITLESRKKKQRHYSSSVACKPKAPRQFRCCDCDREFLDQAKFKKHVRKGCSNTRCRGLQPLIHAGAVRGGGDRRSNEGDGDRRSDGEVGIEEGTGVWWIEEPTGGMGIEEATGGDGDRRSDDRSDACNFGFGTASELSSHMELGVHRRFTPGLKRIRGDVGYDGPLEDDRAEMLDLLDSLRLTGQASCFGGSAGRSNHGERSSGGERSD